MRRKDREIADPQSVIELLASFDTVRIAMNGDPFPYLVPVSFGMEIVDGRSVLYFHCAKAGEKIDRLSADPRVCIEADRFIGTQKTAHGITTRYESVIGFGQASIVDDENEILHALKLITRHYGFTDYPLTRCKGLENVRIYRLDIERLNGKRNDPDT